MLAVAIALVSVALGAALGLVRAESRALVRALQWLAVVAAALVIFASLLPQAVEASGSAALFVFVATLALPTLLSRFVRARAGGSLGLELGYAGLLLHKVGDGVGLGAYAARPHLEVLLAIAVHTVPMTAAVALAYAERAGTRSALLRTGGIAAAILVGILAVAVVPQELVLANEGWIAAAVAGLLFHVLGHGWRALAQQPARALGETP